MSDFEAIATRLVASQEALALELRRLTVLLEKNEVDRELSPYWRHADGSPVTRRECEALGNRFEGPDGIREALIAAAPNGVSVAALDSIKRRYG